MLAGETWVSADHELPLISEASPDSFLKSVNHSLAKEEPEIMDIVRRRSFYGWSITQTSLRLRFTYGLLRT